MIGLGSDKKHHVHLYFDDSKGYSHVRIPSARRVEASRSNTFAFTPQKKFFINIFYLFCRHFESCDFCFIIIHILPCLTFCLCPDFVDCHEYWLKNRGKGRAILSRRKTQMLRMEIVSLGKNMKKILQRGKSFVHSWSLSL